MTNIPLVMYKVKEKWLHMSKILDVTTLSNKLKSELISNLVETCYTEVVPSSRRGRGDHEADIYVDDQPLEIKTCYNGRSWRGGAFSKRSSDYLMVGWKDIGNTIELFALSVNLLESDWKGGNVGNYYATNIDLDFLLKRGGQVAYGGVIKKKKNHHPEYR